jgi:transcriptional regulator with XRE-family HTH domain
MTDKSAPDSLLIGRRVKALREAAGLSQGQLATYAEVSRSYVTRLEHGEFAKPSYARLESIARTLGRTLDEIVRTDPGASEVFVAAPADKAGAIKRLLRYSADQLNRLAEGAAVLFSAPMDDEPAEQNAEDEGSHEDKDQQPPDHATIVRPIIEADHWHPHPSFPIERMFVS